MRVVAQRVSCASVTVDEESVGAIGLGVLCYLGVGRGDSDEDAIAVADKIAGLRIFEDDTGKMSRSVVDVRGEVLVVSQFTLFGDVRKGRRPSFDKAAEPSDAVKLYEKVCERVGQYVPTQTGRFAASMVVHAQVLGPVTLLIDSQRLF